MDAPRESQPTKTPCRREDAVQVLRRLRESGQVAYFAGGCVRDELLGLQPKDYDVATDATPDRVRELFPAARAVGAAFGVMLVRQGRSVVEVVTFRAEGPYLDGRRPSQVYFTSPQEDARRRDFTINGLFLDPLNGQVIDYVGGQEDLKSRVLRAIGQPVERFEEDHLRLLRAVRFAARFELTIEATTAAAIRSHAALLKRISPERIAEELRLMLTPPTRATAWTMFMDFGLTSEIFRFLPPPTQGRFDRDKSIFLHLPTIVTIPFGLALAAGALCYRREPNVEIRQLLRREEIQRIVRAARQALRISNDEADHIRGTLNGVATMLDEPPATVATMKRFLATPTAASARHLMNALAATGHSPQRIAAVSERLADLEKGEYAPPPLITGDDLTAAGFRPGPIFKRILDRVYDAQLEGRVSTKDEALQVAKQLARQPDPSPSTAQDDRI